MNYFELQRQAEKEIFDACKFGDLQKLIKLRTEVVSEMTNNKYYLLKIDRAIQKRLEGDFYVQEA